MISHSQKNVQIYSLCFAEVYKIEIFYVRFLSTYLFELGRLSCHVGKAFNSERIMPVKS